ncbi:MAG: hypothetical protein AAFP89_07000 [Bacteroidota bacterium]
MKRILTFGLVLLSFALQLQAQSEAFPRSVSIDVLGITIPNHPVELIYRKDNPRFTRRTSLSVRAETVDYASPVSRTFPFNSIGIQEQQGFNMQVGFSQGIQKEKKIGKAVVAYWGVDAALGYEYFTYDYGVIGNSPADNLRREQIHQRTGHILSIGVRPLMGFQYRLLPNLGLGMECSFLVAAHTMWTDDFRLNTTRTFDTQTILDQEQVDFQNMTQRWVFQTFTNSPADVALWLSFYFD